MANVRSVEGPTTGKQIKKNSAMYFSLGQNFQKHKLYNGLLSLEMDNSTTSGPFQGM